MDNGDGKILVDEYFGDVGMEGRKKRRAKEELKQSVFGAFVDEQGSGRCYYVRCEKPVLWSHRFTSIRATPAIVKHLLRCTKPFGTARYR